MGRHNSLQQVTKAPRCVYSFWELHGELDTVAAKVHLPNRSSWLDELKRKNQLELLIAVLVVVTCQMTALLSFQVSKKSHRQLGLLRGKG